MLVASPHLTPTLLPSHFLLPPRWSAYGWWLMLLLLLEHLLIMGFNITYLVLIAQEDECGGLSSHFGSDKTAAQMRVCSGAAWAARKLLWGKAV